LGKHHDKLLNRLEALRKSTGLTQQQLSEAAEVSRKSINAIENGSLRSINGFGTENR
jgi:DNA-binding XRE family transcriptional regulator